MRAMPMQSGGGTGRRMPTPSVQQKVVNQKVDLKPQGNTVSVTASSDNPFERKNQVQIHTQASGGYPGVPESMQSRGIQHDMLPGMGEDPQKTVADSGEPGVVENLLTTAKDFGLARENRKLQEQEAKKAQAEARAAAAKAEADIARSRVDELRATMASGIRNTSVDTGLGFKVNVPLILGGAALLGVAYMMSKKNKK